MKRRNFLKSSGLLSLSPFVPQFVNQLSASTLAEADKKILVVIEMNGGNDGINTLVPFADAEYAKLRPKLKLDTSRLHKINDDLALHYSMSGSKTQFDAGELAIINGVGYPNPNRSHFESLNIWHRGLRDSKRESGAGWLGSALDSVRDPDSVKMDGYFVGTDAVSAAMVSRRAQVAALSRFQDLQLNRQIVEVAGSQPENDIGNFVQRQISNAYATSSQIESASKQDQPGGFPNSRLGQQMRLVSQLIKSGSGARVYYTVQTGYDTHSVQANIHSSLLFQLSSAMKAFVDDLKKSKLDDRVVVLAFSEFGRRVNENASQGTDHGTAGPVFLAGTKINSGLMGEKTSLTDLKDGDLKSQFDFRSLYASVLDNWLEIPSEKVLGKKFEYLELFA